MTTNTAYPSAWSPRPVLKDAALHWLTGLGLLCAGVALLYPVAGVRFSGYLLPFCAYLVLGLTILLFIPDHRPHRSFGLANRITLTRGLLAAFLTGFIGQPQLLAETGWYLIGLALFCLLLDGFDGRAARTSGAASAFGARFDMETDGFLILILSALAWSTGKLGAWILLAGAMRYLFLAAGLALPWLRAPLPPSKRRQTVCVIQVVALFLLLAPVLPEWGAAAIGAIALASLIWSFAIDVAWLRRNRRSA